MSVCIRLALVSWVSLLPGLSPVWAQATAAEPEQPAPEAGQPAAPEPAPEPAPGPKSQAFRKLFSQTLTRSGKIGLSSNTPSGAADASSMRSVFLLIYHAFIFESSDCSVQSR